MKMKSYQFPKTPPKKHTFPNGVDAINEENNSSNKESLLVSPHSKFSRYSPRLQEDSFGSIQHSLYRYTKPFESPQFLRTDQKIATKRYGSTSTDKKLKYTDPDFNRFKESNKQIFQQKIQQLLAIIEEKDEKINNLQMRMSTKKNILQPQQLNTFSPNRSDTISFDENKEDRKTESLRREILFLTQNNLQLFEEVHRLSIMCQELKQKTSKESMQVKGLQAKLLQVKKQFEKERQMNMRLVYEKQEMMKNYEQEIRLFLKMKEVWEQNYARQESETLTGRNKRKSIYERELRKKK